MDKYLASSRGIWDKKGDYGIPLTNRGVILPNFQWPCSICQSLLACPTSGLASTKRGHFQETNMRQRKKKQKWLPNRQPLNLHANCCERWRETPRARNGSARIWTPCHAAFKSTANQGVALYQGLRACCKHRDLEKRHAGLDEATLATGFWELWGA